MHAWLLVFWLTANPNAGIQIQSVASKAACVHVGAQIKKEFPGEVTFTCIENAAPVKSHGPKKTRKHH